MKTQVTFACLALAFGLSACDGAAGEKADAEARARAAEAEKANKLKEGIAHNVECLSALRWQKPALSAAGIGDLAIYEDYYAGKLQGVLGSEIVAGEGGAPALNRANTHDYVNWAYANDVKTFTGGGDANNDGTVSTTEQYGRGFNIVGSCIQAVAEMGKGPLAGKDKVGRAARMEALRRQLKPKGA